MAEAQYTVAVRVVINDGKGGSEDANANFTNPDKNKALEKGVAWLTSQKEQASGKGRNKE